MQPLRQILGAASGSDKIIALAEGDDPRNVEAALMIRDESVARVILVGNPEIITTHMAAHGTSPIDLTGQIDIHDPANSPLLDEFRDTLVDLRAHKGMTPEQATTQVRQRLTFAALLVQTGRADGTVGGSVETTSDTVRTALQIIGKAPGAAMVSSFFFMLYCKEHHTVKGAHIFADCGLVVDPDARELAEIARASAASYSALTGDTARVAMLSFSTAGSADHPKVSKVVEATQRAKAADPDLIIDGELQFDAAFVPEVAASKASESSLGGAANVFVFPSLNAGNLGYKIAQRVGGATAIGPVLQGLAKPANDLSRGCTAEDILHMAAVTVAQSDALDRTRMAGLGVTT
ncbi:Ethanolamine utilization protein EutD [Shimia sp. SK013]|uniref:phosphate acetyltransferase n=1 Tax=Shimia sp. SK013 TaxID=1389006 RepID=UPI0006B506A9|nr:phosphate acetyltransferase [Shimia sp. SK013]KPA20476.1 Ethanolamine utilization protein EutD [Shimia sp. SK013]